MPVVFYKPLSHQTAICVWAMDGSEEETLKGLRLSKSDEALIARQKLPKRRTEKAACRLALAFLLGQRDLTVWYDCEGAPHIDNYYVSFSHTAGYAAVAISAAHPVGIDIEQVGGRLPRLAHKFLNAKELSAVIKTDNRLLHFYWGAKEAALKLNGQKDIDFINNITVNNDGKGGGTATLLSEEKIRITSLSSWLIRNCVVILAESEK